MSDTRSDDKKGEATPRTDALLPVLLQEAREFDGYISSAHYSSKLVEHARQLERELAIEIKNKKQFERDWLEACDQLSSRSAIAPTKDNMERVDIAGQIETQFPAQLPPDDYQFEFIFGVKLDYRDWRVVLAALRSAPSANAPSEAWDLIERFAAPIGMEMADCQAAWGTEGEAKYLARMLLFKRDRALKSEATESGAKE